MSDRTAPLSPLKQAYLALEALQAKLEAAERRHREPIAIIGLGCRFPGGADSPQAFWRLLREGRDATREVPAERWDVDAVYDPDPETPGKTHTRRAGFLAERVDEFEPQFFGIAPREALSLDPQQRLLLEVAWEALEHAGLAPDRLAGSRTGVFIGIASGDYANLLLKLDDPTRLDVYYASGIAHSVAAGRLSYVLGLQGPSLALDTACSSSLVAVHLAVQSLRRGECRLALAGGVNLILAPDNTIAFAKANMLAADGRCKTFDAHADGFADGEGCGAIVLKRLSDALADKDRILAVIRGSAINQDGASSGLTAPNGPAQESVIRDALADADVAPAAVSCVEAHGTGTSLGDPIEVQALAHVLREGRPAERPFWLGSVKTNLGHLEAAAGVAGLIKLVLMLQHKEIVPHLNFETPNPFIPWAEVPALIPRQVTPWVTAGERRIGSVSSFGFSGTNAHLVLAEAPEAAPPSETLTRPLHVLALSARSSSALKTLASRYREYLADSAPGPLADVAFTANAGRTHFAHRLAVPAAAPAELSEKLAAFCAGEMLAGFHTGETLSTDRPKIAFLFTGQGAQYVGMGRQLYQTQPVFRAALDRCAQLLQPHLPLPLLDVIFDAGRTPGDDSHHRPLSAVHRLDQTAYTQPALFALEYALAELWRSWGIEPSAVLGHSVGEYVAACVAGVFSLEDGLRLIAERGRLMGALPAGGAMAAVFADAATVADAIQPYAAHLAIAARNGPENTVISGRSEAVEAVLATLAQAGLKARRLNVSHAFHSPLMEPMLADFERIAQTVTYHPPRIRLISNLTGQPLTGAPDAAYWRRHVREAVQFAPSLETLRQQGYEIFVEVGPGATLLGMGQRTLDARLPDEVGLWLPSLRPNQADWQTLLHSLSALYVRGVNVDWTAFDKPYTRRKVSLPTYPFERQRYWFDSTPGRRKRAGRAFTSAATHPLLGQQLRSALAETQFESELHVADLSCLNDHRLHGTAVLPATGFVEMALAAGASALRSETLVLEDLNIGEPLIVRDDEGRLCQAILKPDGAFEVHSLSEGGEWRRHATARVTKTAAPHLPALELDSIRARCGETISADAHYALLREHGLDFGPSLHGVRAIWRRPGEALGDVQLPEAFTHETGRYRLHPALLDACLQTVAAAHESQGALYLPIHLDRLELHRPPGNRLWSHVLIHAAAPETLSADLTLYAEDGRAVARLEGLHLKRAEREALLRSLQPVNLDEWLYHVQWRPSPLPQPASTPTRLETLVAETQSQAEALSRQHRLPEYAQLLARLEALSVEYVLHALRQMGWDMRVGQRVTTAALTERLGVAQRHQRLFGRLLEMLAEDGCLARVGDGWEVRRAPAAREPQVVWQRLSADYASVTGGEMALLGRGGPKLAEALQGRVDALQILFPGGSFDDAERLYHQSPFAQVYNQLVADALARWVAQTAPDQRLRVLEIGGGTGGTTGYVLPVLPPSRTEYTFTDVSPLFAARAQERFGPFPFLTCQALDIESDPASQGFAGRQFEIVIAANVIHATADLRRTLRHVQQLLAPGGVLIMIEVTHASRWVDLTFGLTEGWWKFTDHDLRPAYPLLTRDQWLALLSELGFTQPQALPQAAGATDPFSQQAIFLAAAPQAVASGRWLILADAGGVGEALAQTLEAQGHMCALAFAGDSFAARERGRWQLNPFAPEDLRRWLREALDGGAGVVYLWSLDATFGEAAEARGSAGLLHLTQALLTADWPETPRLHLVMRHAQPANFEPVKAAASPILGFARTLALEHPELRCVCVDLGARAAGEINLLAAELLAGDDEPEVALREGARYAARLAKLPAAKAAPPRQLTITARGALDNLSLTPATRHAPGPGEVTLRVIASGLNFKDVMNVLGMYPGDPGPLGGECAGVVEAVGAGVSVLRVGDEVIALAGGCFSAYVTAAAELVAPKPATLSWAEAASTAIPFITAHFTLQHLGRMQAGERVLIHAAAGGVGLAAVQLARHAGLEIFATAGSAEKRAHLRSLGVPHVLNSRTLDFASEIMTRTGGRGVDLVLNSLAGDFVRASLDVLAPQGRFLEIGKSDLLTEAEAARLGAGRTYHVVDWSEATRNDPGFIRQILLEVLAGLLAGTLEPLPVRAFPLEAATDAFRWMAQARQIGKIVIEQPRPFALRGEASYLITGGLTGLGLLTARWLAERGARRLVLMGRREPGEAARAVIAELERAGCQVRVAQGDVSRREDVARVLADIEQSGSPLRGVIHSAGVLDDGALLHQDWSRFLHVMLPKIDGARHLHDLTRQQPLDFFVLYSSVASLLGSAGQANHAAANAFLDALAHERRAAGLPALSINWGPWSEVGAAAERGADVRAAARGLGSLTPEQGLQLLGRLLEQEVVQAGALPIHWAQFERTSPFIAEVRRRMVEAAPVLPSTRVIEPEWQQRLIEAPAHKRPALLLAFVQEQAGRVLGLPGPEAARLPDHTPLRELGLDSLMAVELRNRLGAGLALKRKLPATVVFDYPTPAAIAGYLGELPELRELLPAAEVPEAALPALPAHEAEVKVNGAAGLLDSIEGLSDEEVDRLLDRAGLNDQVT